MYYGIVLGARETDGAVLYRFQTNSTGSVWAAGGESIDSSGRVYIGQRARLQAEPQPEPPEQR